MPATTMSKVDLMLLGMLVQRPMHGYELVEVLSSPGMDAWVKLGRTSVYYALGRLDKNGLVSKHAERQGGKPERTVYSVTDEGRTAFYSAVEDALESPGESMNEFEVALYYANQLEPSSVASRMATRLESLADMSGMIADTLDHARRLGEGPLALVLEHRLAVMKANVDFLAKLIDYFNGEASGGPAPVLSGSLEETLPSEVLRNLAAAGRTGELRINVGDRVVGTFAFDHGTLLGFRSESGVDPDRGLASVFRIRDGLYEFISDAASTSAFAPVGGLANAILIGTRGMESLDLVRAMAPEPGTLLGVKEGFEYEIIGLDLTEEERAVLAELDGVRTISELAHVVGAELRATTRTLYPLWANGWVVRVDRTKRGLVEAVVAFLHMWVEAVGVMVDPPDVRRILEDTSYAAKGTGVPDFGAAMQDLSAVRFAGDVQAVAGMACMYLDILHRSITVRLGEAFVHDAESGILRRLPGDREQILAAYGVIRTDGGR